jgi:DUF3040 family protein
MRLSEREQRVLAEIEHALSQQDPRFAAQFAAHAATPARGWMRRVLALFGHRRR